ncbi:MAG: 16S rRNA (cytosine(1402)-N(4))-methyltransferase [Bdellovibrionales bacterium RIFOXYD1_FULL_53_11]|nr:MAG: 16S rRNA (cytosine(1402)-N(4))-methyltransferase [Bdellovibrionales bacterium RIFOXYD1_FULL_53_11]
MEDFYNTVHKPVMLQEVVDAMRVPFDAAARPAVLIDCTLGGGGHADAFLKALPGHRVVAIDRDEAAIKAAELRFAGEIKAGRLTLVHGGFGGIAELAVGPVLGIFADLGFSSDQMDDPGRGLSFNSEAFPDMRLDRSRGQTCFDLLQTTSEAGLEKIFREYGEERYSRRIAANIMQAKREKRLPKTSKGLAELIAFSSPAAGRRGHGRLHPATRAFQALRIAVNNELAELDKLLEDGMMLLEGGGRMGVISFHSLEDRRVKTAFRKFQPLFKKPRLPGERELGDNPRSRSAKLRVAVKPPESAP